MLRFLVISIFQHESYGINIRGGDDGTCNLSMVSEPKEPKFVIYPAAQNNSIMQQLNESMYYA